VPVRARKLMMSVVAVVAIAGVLPYAGLGILGPATTASGDITPPLRTRYGIRSQR
jgi:hypothetical protein